MQFFEVKDRSGRIIYLTKERWNHIIIEHLTVSNKLEDVKETLVNPLIIRESEYDTNVRFYYKYYKNVKLKAKYLIVVVKYLNGKGFIITSFYTDKIKGLK